MVPRCVDRCPCLNRAEAFASQCVLHGLVTPCTSGPRRGREGAGGEGWCGVTTRRWPLDLVGNVSPVFRVVRYRLRATFGRRWTGYLAIVLLIGLLGGLAIGSIAAARRTQSSYPTFLASTNPSTLFVPTANWQPGSPNSAGADLGPSSASSACRFVRAVENEYNINAATGRA